VPLSLRGREALALASVVLVVVAVGTVAHMAGVAQLTMQSAAEESQLLARQLFHQSARTLAAGAAPGALPRDGSLRALMEGMVGYSRVVVYAAIVDPEGRAVVHSDPGLEGSALAPRPGLDAVLGLAHLRRVVALLGEPEIYESRLPLRLGERPFGEIRVGISTSLVRQALRQALVQGLALGALAVAVALAAGLGAGRVLLQAARRVVRRVGLLTRGEPGQGVELRRGEDMGALAERVQGLGDLVAEHHLRAVAQQEHPVLEPVQGADPVRTVESLVSYAQKLAALGRLTSGVAHEVRNPLNAMRIHLELLRTRLRATAAGAPLAAEIAEPVEVIAQEIRRLDRVVDGFLRFMRTQDLQLEPLDVSALLADVARLCGPEAARVGVRIALDAGEGVPPVTGDDALLRQALTNLVQNAIQAMPDGGALTLGSRALPDGAVELRVSDQGVGIAPEDVERIFRLYYTTRPEGSGIGLSLVYRIAQLHDGRIDVDSSLGKGTTMILTLPAAPPA
jgi:signal transduction histidine kinase